MGGNARHSPRRAEDRGGCADFPFDFFANHFVQPIVLQMLLKLVSLAQHWDVPSILWLFRWAEKLWVLEGEVWNIRAVNAPWLTHPKVLLSLLCAAPFTLAANSPSSPWGLEELHCGIALGPLHFLGLFCCALGTLWAGAVLAPAGQRELGHSNSPWSV